MNGRGDLLQPQSVCHRECDFTDHVARIRSDNCCSNNCVRSGDAEIVFTGGFLADAFWLAIWTSIERGSPREAALNWLWPFFERVAMCSGREFARSPRAELKSLRDRCSLCCASSKTCCCLGSEDFDLVLIDTPPQTNVSTVWSALCASDFAISPVPADAFGVQSIASILNLVAHVQSGPNPRLLILGYVLSMLHRNSVNDAYRETLRRLHGSQVFDTEIPHAAAFKEAISERKPLVNYKPRVKGSKLIAALGEEIEQRAAAVSGGKVAA